jgi:hypothetical protein
MQAPSSLPCRTVVLAVVFGLILFGACNKRKKDPSSQTLTPTPQANPAAQQPHLLQPKRPEPVVRLKAFELFDMGKDGEEKYKGKVVHISGLVDVNSTKRPGPGGTSTLVVKAKPGEPPYAIATFGHDSETLLFGSRYQPPSVSLQATYRGRDERGTVLLDDAKVVSLTQHYPWFDFRPDNPRKPRTTPPPEKKNTPKPQTTPPSEKKKTPVAVTAQQLAQGLQDDLNATYGRYYGVPLQIEGVVAKQLQDKGAITMLQFDPPVTDKKTNKPVEFAVFCGLRRRVRVKSPAAVELAVGKRVTLVGQLSAAGNDQATLTSCVLQKQGKK